MINWLRRMFRREPPYEPYDVEADKAAIEAGFDETLARFDEMMAGLEEVPEPKPTIKRSRGRVK